MYDLQRSVTRPVQNDRTRITSYNVCYTKLLRLPGAAFPWNQATHAYISDTLAARTGHDNLLEMWGSVAPDFFNYIFDSEVCPGWVSNQTHGTYAETFLKVWDAAESEKEDALAYGVITSYSIHYTKLYERRYRCFLKSLRYRYAASKPSPGLR